MAEEKILPFMSEEIIVNILQKLQADALSRLRCVSEQWRRLISEDITSRKKLLLKNTSMEDREVSFLSIDQTTCKVEYLDIPWKSKHTWIYGSCHGLILVAVLDDFFLWNPFTGYSQKFLSLDGLSKTQNCRIVGLCFDSVNNEYKIVMSPKHSVVVPTGSAMVGSSRNKTWKHIDFPYQHGFPLKSGPMLNNHVHWASSKLDSEVTLYATLIIYFDAEIDEFVELPMPSPHKEGEGEGDVIVGLGVLDGCLCMTRSIGHCVRKAQIMAMKEYGVGESWTTLFIVEGPFFTTCFTPLFYCGEKEGEEVMMKIAEFGSESILAYDISAKSRRNISTSLYSQYETVYEETSTRPRPTGYDWEEELDFYTEKFNSNYVRTVKRDDNGCWYVAKEEGRHCGKEDFFFKNSI